MKYKLTENINTYLIEADEESPEIAKAEQELQDVLDNKGDPVEDVLNGEGIDAGEDFDSEATYKKYLAKKQTAKFWESYYKQRWGANASFVKNLGKAFQIEIEKLGFKSDTNPFIAYVMAILANDELRKAIGKDPQNIYGTIHNEYIHHNISDDMLYGETSTIGHLKFTSNENIFWHPILFQQGPTNIKNYIKIQQQLANFEWPTPSSDSEASNLAKFLSKLGTGDDAKKLAIIGALTKITPDLYANSAAANAKPNFIDPTNSGIAWPIIKKPENWFKTLRPLNELITISKAILGDAYGDIAEKPAAKESDITSKLINNTRLIRNPAKDLLTLAKVTLVTTPFESYSTISDKLTRLVLVTDSSGSTASVNVLNKILTADFPSGILYKNYVEALKQFRLTVTDRILIIQTALNSWLQKMSYDLSKLSS